MLGLDEMKEAEDVGFIGGKLTNAATTKLNDMSMRSIERICLVRGITVADWLREIAITELLKEFHHSNSMKDVWDNTRDTSNTSYSEIKKA